MGQWSPVIPVEMGHDKAGGDMCPTTIVKNERGLSTRVAAQFGAHDPRQPIE
jgi:hypothetical protein